MSLLPRGILPNLRRAWASYPVVVLEGLRATGKSTLVAGLVPPQQIRDLALEGERDRARDDTLGWVESLPFRTVIDEAQLVKGLQLAIKRAVFNAGERPGQFLLTGSARLERDELGGSDPLLGRVKRMRLHPFAQCEREGDPRDVVTALFTDTPSAWDLAPVTASDVVERAAAGGLPRSWSLTGADRSEFLTQYASGLFDGDIYETGRNRDGILRLFRWLVGSSGERRNIAEFAQKVGLDKATVEAYLDALSSVHLIEHVPAFRHNATDRETNRPRLFVADPAFVAAGLLQAPASAGSMHFDDARYGSLLETFVATELLRVLTWSETVAGLLHWRANQGEEVDLVLERTDGSIVGIEVKSAREATSKHFSGLRLLRRRYSDRFVRGYVIHSGDHPLRFEDDLWALPFSALWSIGNPVDAARSRDGAPVFDQIGTAARTAQERLGLVSRERVIQRSEELDRVLVAVDARLEVLAEQLVASGLTTAPGLVAGRAGLARASRAGELIWTDRRTLNVYNEERRLGGSIAVIGQANATGPVAWTLLVNRNGAQIIGQEAQVTDGDHIGTIDAMLIAFLERFPDFVAGFFV